MSTPQSFMREAIRLAREGMESGRGGPFGAVVVHAGQIVGRGQNAVLATQDPTAHAEVVAIRAACAHLGRFQLSDCVLYTSCEPCPMCLGAIYWARLQGIYYACTRQDAAAIAFDDDFIYHELARPWPARQLPGTPLLRDEALPVFAQWAAKADRQPY